ncbi:basic helix-loop-helix domain-containing protein [Sarcoptes scabiei]|nr:basic helix-loop-helix domain-containing protein [Sarcoptes scabiei]
MIFFCRRTMTVLLFKNVDIFTIPLYVINRNSLGFFDDSEQLFELSKKKSRKTSLILIPCLPGTWSICYHSLSLLSLRAFLNHHHHHHLLLLPTLTSYSKKILEILIHFVK